MLLFQHLESVIRAKIPGITSVINKSIDELESEMDHLGRPIAVDAGVSFILYCCCCCCSLRDYILSNFTAPFQAQLYTILELCRAFDKIFKEHLDGGYVHHLSFSLTLICNQVTSVYLTNPNLHLPWVLWVKIVHVM